MVNDMQTRKQSFYYTKRDGGKNKRTLYFFWRVKVTEVYDMLGLKFDCRGRGGI